MDKIIRKIGKAWTDKIRQSAAHAERQGKLSSFVNLATSSFAGFLEGLAGRPRVVARSLSTGSRYLGWNSPEAQWLRHASLLAQGSGLLLVVAPLVATAIDGYVRTRAHRLARTSIARARQISIALREAMRNAGFTRDHQEKPGSKR